MIAWVTKGWLVPCIALAIVLAACGDSAKNDSANGNGTNSDGTTEEVAADDAAPTVDGYEGNGKQLADDGYRRYNVESGIVTIKKEGVETGTEMIYFDRWGMREAKYIQSTTSVGNITKEKKTIDLIDGEWIYNVDVDTKQATKMKNPLFATLTKSGSEKNLSETGKKMLERMGGKKIGEENVAGKPCEVWEVGGMNTKSWVWQGITLKLESNAMNNMLKYEATNIEEDADVDPMKLRIPADVTIVDKGAALEQMLKKGKGK